MTTILPFSQRPNVVRIPFPQPAYLTLRGAGNMRRDGEARHGLYGRLGIDPASVHVAEQVHSRNVVDIDQTPPVAKTALGENLHGSVDGLATSNRSCILGVTVADCMPVFVCDPVKGRRVLLHSGWRGTGILDTALCTMERGGSDPADIVVCLGPCISSASYRVDQARAEKFSAEWGPMCVSVRNGEHFLDLRRANQEICARHGIEVVNTIDHCTFTTPELGSYRREGPENYTLMLALLGSEETQINA